MNQPSESFSLEIHDSLPLRAALVWGRGLQPFAKTEKAPAYLVERIGKVRAAGETYLSPERKAAVRDMLRHGKYKPSGRSKPSNEYLLAAALSGQQPLGDFPLVNPVVDINNVLSLEYGYPASVFDEAKTGPRLCLRRGLAGEAYVFNQGGQSIDLEDLLLVARLGMDKESSVWEACGNPVKDAMVTKVFEGARDVLAVIYQPLAEEPSVLEACAQAFAGLLKSECGAETSGFSLVQA